jgi:hypothetical protein
MTLSKPLPSESDALVLHQLRDAFLFSDEQMTELTEPERRGEFTLERLRQLRPEVIAEVVRLRGEWMGRLPIAKALRVSVNTIAVIDAEYSESIESLRLKEVELWRSGANQLVRQISLEPDKVPWAVKALAASQLMEKAELMAGRATQRIESLERVDIEATWRDYLAGLPKQLSGDQVRELESPAIGLLGENLAPMAREVAGSAPPADDLVPVGGSDLQSPSYAGVTEVIDPNLTTSPTSNPTVSHDSEPDPDPAGGGGDRPPPRGAPAQTHTSSDKIITNAPGAPPPAP